MLTVVKTETPTPGEGMLLVEVKAAGLNYADIMARSGFYPQVPKAPFALGFEIAGVVTDAPKTSASSRDQHGITLFDPGLVKKNVGRETLHERSPLRRQSRFLPDSILHLLSLCHRMCRITTSCQRDRRN